MGDILSADSAEAMAGAAEVLAAGEEDLYLEQLQYGDGELRQVGVLEVEEALFPVRQLAMLSLVAQGRSATAEALRGRIDRLILRGCESGWRRGSPQPGDRAWRPLDLRPLEGLRLRTLSLSSVSELRWPASMEHLEELTLLLGTIAELPAARKLRKLVLVEVSLPTLDLAAFPALASLRLGSEVEMERLTGMKESNLEHLEVCGGRLRGKLSLEAPPSLRSLQWWCPAGSIALADSPRLTQLFLSMGHVADLQGLQHCSALEELSLEGMSGMQSLQGLPVDALTTLTVRVCPDLEDLSALEGAPRLSQLTVTRCGALSGLGPRETTLPALVVLDLSVLNALHSLALGATPVLRRLRVVVCPKLSRVSLATKGTDFEHVEFYKCGREVGLDLRGLEGVRTKLLKLTGSRIGKTRIPESLWPVVQPPGLVKKRRRTKSNKPAPKRAKGAARGQAARLKTLILSRDLDSIDQAAELVGVLGEEVSGAITHGCVLKRDAPLVESLPKTARSWAKIPGESGNFRHFWDPTWDRLVPNRLLDHSDLLMPYRGHAMRVLAAAGGAPGLAEARSLVLVGRTHASRGRVPVRLDPLAQLKQLERVGVYECEVLQGAQALGGLRRFCGYELGGVSEVAEVAGPREIALVSWRRGRRLKAIGQDERLARLEKLQVNCLVFEASPTDVARLRALRSLSLRVARVDRELLQALAETQVEELDLEVSTWFGSKQVNRIEALKALGLKHLGITPEPLKVRYNRESDTWDEYGLDDLNDLGLESLRLYGVDFEKLNDLKPGLKRLSIHRGARSTYKEGTRLDLEQLACQTTVEELEIRHVPKTRLVGRAIRCEAWPRLKVLRIDRALVTPELVERYEVHAL